MVTLTGGRTDLAPEPVALATRGDDLSDHAHRQLIGYIGLAFPALLFVLAGIRPTDGLEPWRVLRSVSAYYYTGAVAAFVGMLVALALFLFTYRGYRNRYHWADRAAAITAGIASLGVAFFPTAPPAGVAAPSWWTPASAVLHYASAVILFSMFAVFSLWLFRLTAAGEEPTPGKGWRNRIYVACGLAIVGSIVWAGAAAFAGRPIFVPESAALVAFAVSWLTKGCAHRPIARAARFLLKS